MNIIYLYYAAVLCILYSVHASSVDLNFMSVSMYIIRAAGLLDARTHANMPKSMHFDANTQHTGSGHSNIESMHARKDYVDTGKDGKKKLGCLVLRKQAANPK